MTRGSALDAILIYFSITVLLDGFEERRNFKGALGTRHKVSCEYISLLYSENGIADDTYFDLQFGNVCAILQNGCKGAGKPV
jgi:hypothetical protein